MSAYNKFKMYLHYLNPTPFYSSKVYPPVYPDFHLLQIFPFSHIIQNILSILQPIKEVNIRRLQQ